MQKIIDGLFDLEHKLGEHVLQAEDIRDELSNLRDRIEDANDAHAELLAAVKEVLAVQVAVRKADEPAAAKAVLTLQAAIAKAEEEAK